MTQRHAVLPIALLLVVFGSSTNAQIPDPGRQAELARQLLHSSRSDQSGALASVRQIGPQNVTPQLRAALITALEREGRLVARELRGEIPHLDNALLIAGLAHVVAAFRDPRSIVALAGALGNSPPAIHALAEFGGLAAPAVLGVIGSTDDTSVENDALLTLRFMAEGVGGSLTGGTQNRMRQIARERLTTPQKSITTVWAAIDLAVALDDAELRQIVQSLASDRNAVIALRDTEPELIDRTQRAAAERLAGVPPLPRHESVEEFARRWE